MYCLKYVRVISRSKMTSYSHIAYVNKHHMKSRSVNDVIVFWINQRGSVIACKNREEVRRHSPVWRLARLVSGVIQVDVMTGRAIFVGGIRVGRHRPYGSEWYLFRRPTHGTTLDTMPMSLFIIHDLYGALASLLLSARYQILTHFACLSPS